MKRQRHSRRRKKWAKYLLGATLLLVGGISIYLWNIYSGIKETTSKIYQPMEEDSIRSEKTGPEKAAPLSVLLMGVDTGDFGREETGRSDSMMVATINPRTGKTVLLSIPRDTYTEIVGWGTWDKINHAYAFGGTDMAIHTVEELLNIPIDYYATVNMKGIQEVVDAIGGVDLVSPLSFSYGGYEFVEGKPTHMDGKRALAFARMRYEDLDGDYGRQRRQRMVIEGIIDKVASPTLLYNYQEILAALSNNVQTNFPVSEYFTLQSKSYLEAAQNIETEQLDGLGEEGLDGIWYHFVPEVKLLRVQEMLQTELELN